MKFLCGLSVLLMMFGLIWGIFFRNLVWLAAVGMVLGVIACGFSDDEEK